MQAGLDNRRPQKCLGAAGVGVGGGVCPTHLMLHLNSYTVQVIHLKLFLICACVCVVGSTKASDTEPLKLA